MHGSNKFVLTGAGSKLRLKINLRENFDLSELKEYLDARNEFLKGAQVEIIWDPELPPARIHAEVKQILGEEFQSVVIDPYANVYCRDVKTPEYKGLTESTQGFSNDIYSYGLNSKVGEYEQLDGGLYGHINEIKDIYSEDFKGIVPELDTEQNAVVFYGTLRSGQRLESDKTIVLVGDANQASEIISGGDIFVLGALRGTAHAGAFDEKPSSRIIFALSLCPIQLRIGKIITRGDGLQLRKHTQCEVARLDDDRIIVEPYNSKYFHQTVFFKKYRV
ncbi:MAG: hypothetical protein NZT61_01205 [Deltaproteobacteria bacterium]|nr:hypothetical protein [Deltaproteobacteria bacterium]MCX7952930.1 hypothetical protein [Deltaproteobacteria bacterium]